MRVLLLFSLLLCVGCASFSESAQRDLESAQQVLDADPERALTRLEPVLAEYPNHVGARILEARALAALGRHSEAAEAWAFVINVRETKTDEELTLAHREFGRMVGLVVGPVPHRVQGQPESDIRKLIVDAQSSFNFLLDENDEDVDALLGKARCLYRLALANRAGPVVQQVIALEPNNMQALYLNGLIQEHESGVSRTVLAGYFELVRSGDSGLRREVARHLIFLASNGELDETARENVRGVLVRLSRSEQDFPELAKWADSFRRNERTQADVRRFELRFEEIDHAVSQREFEKAWWIVEEMPPGDPRIADKRTFVAEAWTRSLIQKGNKHLETRSLGDAHKVVTELGRVPQDLLSAELRVQSTEFTDHLERLETERAVKKRLGRAETAMRDRNPLRALAHLDGLEELATDEQKKAVFLLRARGLFETGDRSGALVAFDRAGDLETIADKRNYGVLLVEAGRAEEATDFLELMPIGALQGEVLDALIASFERQGNWEKILSRLSDLDSVPGRYEEVRKRACKEAAARRLRLGDPKRALGVLRSYLGPEELGRPPVLVTYLRACFEAGELDTVATLLVGADPRHQATLPPNLTLEVLDRLGERISDEERFRILNRIGGNGTDPIVASQINRLAPRFGSYLPEPGNYSLRFRTTHFAPNDVVEDESLHKARLTWNQERFVFVGESIPREEWWLEEHTWHRKSSRGIARIPVRLVDPEHPPKESFVDKETLWTAEITKAGQKIYVAGKPYEGCIRIRLLPDEDENEAIYLDLAPDIGEIRREVYEDGMKVKVRELLSFDAAPAE